MYIYTVYIQKQHCHDNQYINNKTPPMSGGDVVVNVRYYASNGTSENTETLENVSTLNTENSQCGQL